jgi:hypothetical protein
MGAFGVVVALAAVAVAGLLLSLVARRLARRLGAGSHDGEAVGEPGADRGSHGRT